MRPIDADAMLSQLKPIAYEMGHSSVLISDVSKMLRAWVNRQPTLTQPNEPLTLIQAKKEKHIWFEPLKDWGKVTPDGVLFFGTEERMRWETLNEYWGDPFKVYRYPPEGNDNV